MNNTQDKSRIKENVEASEKTAEQRKAELALFMQKTTTAKEKPQPMSKALKDVVDLISELPIALGDIAITTVPSTDKWRAYVSQKGANKGATIHSAYGYREGNFAVGAPVDGYQMFVSVSVAFVPAK